MQQQTTAAPEKVKRHLRTRKYAQGRNLKNK